MPLSLCSSRLVLLEHQDVKWQDWLHMARNRIKLLGVGEAAKVLGVSRQTFARYVQGGANIPCVIVGKRRRYVKERLEDWALNRERSAV